MRHNAADNITCLDQPWHWRLYCGTFLNLLSYMAERETPVVIS